MSKKQPPVGSKDFYEKVNPYWLDQAARRPRFSCTIQAREGGPASAQGHKLDKKNK